MTKRKVPLIDSSLTKYDLTAKQAAKKLNYSYSYFRVLARDGKVPCRYIFRRYFFCEEELVEFFTKKKNLDQFPKLRKRISERKKRVKKSGKGTQFKSDLLR